jgi:uncharacterized protein (TIGR02246 family)
MMPPDDNTAIRGLLGRLYDAWARGDAEAYAACFAEHSDYITFNGMHLHGRNENAELHGALFRGVLKGTKISAKIESLEFISNDAALIHTVGQSRKASYQTYVVVRSDTGWLIRSFQNTRVQPFSIWLTRRMQRMAGRP